MEIFTGLFSSLWSVVVIVLFFGGSIFVHELGHFLAARRRGLRVDRFSIGFGPAIVKWKGKDGVEYRLSWIPLGGYVALPQLADMRQIEGSKDGAAQAATDRERASIPYGAKIEVLAAGAFFNVIFALILACIIWGTGYPVMKSEQTRTIGAVSETVTNLQGEEVPAPAREAGLRPGDIVEKVDDREIESFADLRLALAVGTGRAEDGRPQTEIEFTRDGEVRTATLYPVLSGEEAMRTIGLSPDDDLVVERVLEGSGAADAGLRAGDVVLRLGGEPVFAREEVSRRLVEGKGAPVELTVSRAGSELTLSVTPKLTRQEDGSERWLIGIGWSSPIVYVHTPPFAEIYRQTKKAYWTLAGLLSPRSDVGLSKLSSPIGIGRGFHQVAQVDWRLVLWFTVLVNVNLAIMNLLPIPVLDGGHIAFATIGKLRGRPLPIGFMQTVQSAFMALLLMMMLYVGYFDVRRIVRDMRRDDAALPTQAPPVPSVPAEDAASK